MWAELNRGDYFDSVWGLSNISGPLFFSFFFFLLFLPTAIWGEIDNSKRMEIMNPVKGCIWASQSTP